ncbi:tRNA-intron lyase [Candidatus Woesearchaeota archaeon]|nr:tRNA-intron lyase [Candidatus Woesearchaeota archaeon]
MIKKQQVSATFYHGTIITENTDLARELYDKSRFGSMQTGKVELNLVETLYLMEKERLQLSDRRKKEISHEQFIAKAKKLEKNFWIKYAVFRDLRTRGYIVKTALKFGADFRVYDRGVKPGEDHAKWVVFPVHESQALTWHEFAAKNRVAHSTKKRLLLAVVDDEGDVSYWESRWLRP